jgi:NAD(P)-dependent dehydrogenase (short-subunit alcohol dehydrogenase family)
MRAAAGRRDDGCMKRLAGKTALITGASRGLGRAIAFTFAREGAGLGICARNQPDLDVAAGILRSLGADVVAIRADIAVDRDRERFLATALDRFGSIDILVNNASTLGRTPLPYLADTDPASFAEVIRVNLEAPFKLTRPVLGGMLLRGQGVVVNVSSDAAVEGYPGWGAYSAAKAGLDALTRVWAAELEGTGVHIHAVDPGDMDTEMHRAAIPDADPLKLRKPEEVAEEFLHLVTEGAESVRVQAASLRTVPQPWLN